MICTELQVGFTVAPSTSGFIHTVYTVNGSVSSIELDWSTAAKVITYDVYDISSSGIVLLTSVETSDFFEEIILYESTELTTISAVVAVSSDILECYSTATSSVYTYIIPHLTAVQITGTNLNVIVDNTYMVTPSSTFFIELSTLPPEDIDIIQPPLVARIEDQDGNITTSYLPTSFSTELTDFGIHTISVSSIPLLSAEDLGTDDYITQALRLGVTPNNIEKTVYTFTNNAYELSASYAACPKYAPTMQTLSGYAPYKSLYPSNTGTSFNLQPTVSAVNYSSSPVVSSIDVEYIGSVQLAELTVYDSLTTIPGFYGFNSSDELPIQLTVNAEITGDEFPTSVVAAACAELILVNPPTVTLEISSIRSVQQEDVLLVDRVVNFNISIDGSLPCACMLNTDLPSSIITLHSATETVVESILGTPDHTIYTAILSAFPLLEASTDVDYITGNQRLLDTGILPIITEFKYMFGFDDNSIPIDNILVDFEVQPITYNNKITDAELRTDISAASAIIYINQFGENISPNIIAIATIGDSDSVTLEELMVHINNHNIYMTVEFNTVSGNSIFNLDSGQIPCYSYTTAPLEGEIIVTARTEDNLEVTTKIIPYSSTQFDFITPTMYFNKFTPSWYASLVNPNAFEVMVWNDSIHTIDTVHTYVNGSDSYPYSDEFTRYSRLVPQWWFQDALEIKSETFPVVNTKLYNSFDGSYIGTSGLATFYFKDDIPTGADGELLVVSPIVSGLTWDVDKLDNVTDRAGYANPLQSASQIYYVDNIYPTVLNITRDGLRDLKSYYWLTNPIPNTITLGTNQELDSAVYAIDFTYPYDNESHPFSVGISGNNVYETVMSPVSVGDNFTVSYYNTSFNATNEQGLISTGYVRTSLLPALSADWYKLVASTMVQPTGQYVHTPYMWVSDNKNNLVSRLYYEDGFDVGTHANCAHNSIQQQYISVPVSAVENMMELDTMTDFMSLTGVTETSNIAIDGLHNAWFTDGGNDIAYKVGPNGTVDVVIQFPADSTPAGICVDSQQNIWVTLADGISSMKYTSDGEFITAVVPGVTAEDYVDDLYRPAGIDVDQDDNVWITFYNPICSIVNKYDSTGEMIFTTALDTQYTPIDIIVDGQIPDQAFVISEFNSAADDINIGALHQIIDGTNTILLSGFNTPSHFNIDANRNIWMYIGNKVLLTYSIETEIWKHFDLTSILDETEVVVSYSAIGGDIVATGGTVVDIDALELDTDITGIAGRSDGTISVINSRNNKVYILTQTDEVLTVQTTFNIYPETPRHGPYNDVLNINSWGTQYTTTVNSYFYEVEDADWEIGVQAHGDWTGLRRTLKYTPVNTSEAYMISGYSTPFQIKASPPEIRIINDSFDLSESLSHMFPGVINELDFPVLHNELIPGSLGTAASGHQTIGRQYFEKVANFVRNHNDIDFCNVSQLYNIAAMLGVTLDDYNLSYPADIIRCINILSVNHKRLFGDVDNYNRRFDLSDDIRPGDDTTTINNRRNFYTTPLSATTYIPAGYELVAHDLILNKYDLLYINAPITELAMISGYGLRKQVYNFDAGVFNQYKFYKYKENDAKSLVNSHIDWDSTYTTVVSSASSIDEWWKDDGIVDQMFNFYLNKGLGFIELD